MATMISSNNGNALVMTDSWPMVNGSKDPGKIAIFLLITGIA
jgi:hypothetical protein